MKNRVFAFFLLPALLTGCSGPGAGKRATSIKATGEILPDLRLHGRIATINHQGQFVVVDFNVGGIPPLQARMNVYRGNNVVGTINLSGPINDNLVAADIVSGDLEVGDMAIWDQKKPPDGTSKNP